MMLPPKAYRFIFLNAIRVLSLISLILVFASNIVVMVDDVNAVRSANELSKSPANATLTDDCDYLDGSTVPNQAAGPFWAILNRLFIIFQVLTLFFSEIGWPQAFFQAFFPVLGKDFGVGAIGVIECLVGAAVLSHHVDNFPMVAAFLLFSIGCLNIILALIFGSSVRSKRSLTSWRDRVPTLPKSRADLESVAGSVKSEIFGDSNEKSSRFKGYGFGRQGEKAAALKGFIISKPSASLPEYSTKI